MVTTSAPSDPSGSSGGREPSVKEVRRTDDATDHGSNVALSQQGVVAVGQFSTSADRRQRMPASMNSSISPSNTADGLPTSKFVRRSFTIW